MTTEQRNTPTAPPPQPTHRPRPRKTSTGVYPTIRH
jgi:hypothetical protein